MTMTNEEIQDIMMGHSDDFIVECANDLQRNIIPEDSPLRILEDQCYDDGQFLVHIMGLGCLLSGELV